MARYLHFVRDMQWLSRLMLRWGWIRLSDYGLYVTPTGQLSSMNHLPVSGSLGFDPNWSNVPDPDFHYAAMAAPGATVAEPAVPMSGSVPAVAAGAMPPRMLPLPAPEPTVTHAPWGASMVAPIEAFEPEELGMEMESESEAPDEEAVWEQALARARNMPTSAAACGAEDEPAVQGDVEEQDWEAIVQAAKARAERSETEISDLHLPAVAPMAGVLSVESVVARDQQSANQNQQAQEPSAREANAGLGDAWDSTLEEARGREREAAEKKLRGMREVQRLQKRASLKSFVPTLPPQQAGPPRRRVAVGTEPPPSREASSANCAPKMAAPPAPPVRSKPVPAASPLPRITTRSQINRS